MGRNREIADVQEGMKKVTLKKVGRRRVKQVPDSFACHSNHASDVDQTGSSWNLST